MINFTNESWINPLHGYEEGGLWGDSNWGSGKRSWSQPSKVLVAKLTSTIGSNKVTTLLSPVGQPHQHHTGRR